MTRFARAKGSKASNEKLPEPATPWSEMKQQLLAKKQEEDTKEKRDELNAQRMHNYKQFLNEVEEEENKKTTWAEFPGVTKGHEKTKVKKTKAKEKLLMGSSKEIIVGNTSSKKNKSKGADQDVDEDFNKLKGKLDRILDRNQSDSDDEAPDEVSSKVELPEIKVRKTKQKGEKKRKKPISGNSENVNEGPVKKKFKLDDSPTSEIETNGKVKSRFQKKQAEVSAGDSHASESETNGKVKSHRQKKRAEVSAGDSHTSEIKTNGKVKDHLQKKQPEVPVRKVQTNGSSTNNNEGENIELDEISKKKIAKKEKKKLKQLEKRKLKKAQKRAEREAQQLLENESQKNENVLQDDKPFDNNPQFYKNRNFGEQQQETNEVPSKENKLKRKSEVAENEVTPKKKKFKDEKTRRKPKSPKTLIIDGQTVEVEYVDGFPVKKEDAQRLKQLRTQMISKGLPRSEINKALKLERRRAEKALTRQKRMICFNCRKSGHNLSECPELGKDEIAQSIGVGICFKCGSTEHKSFECRVVQGDNFKHASCFICKEQGHISRQCPDNPRGLYPKGGACNVCGDVTHLKKDCPQYQEQQQQEGGVKADLMNEYNPDDLGEDSDKKIVKKKADKIVKF